MTKTEFQRIVDCSLEYGRGYIKEGKVATYIPQLGKANADHIGVCIKTTDGDTFKSGDCNIEFTMQSISKTMSLVMALQKVGYDGVFSKVGLEPTGDAFNSIVKLETRDKNPLNPMINAGAIAVASTLVSKNGFDDFLKLVRKMCKRDTITLNEAVYLSEKNAGSRNRSMAYLMQSDGVLASDAEDALEIYFKMCSINVTAVDLANYALLLSNDGIDCENGERIIENWIVRIVKTLMVTCGMYDGSGEFAVKVGIPAKSGVGGGIIAAVEKKMGIATFSPALDSKGNSIGSYKILEYLSRELNLHCFSDVECKID